MAGFSGGCECSIFEQRCQNAEIAGGLKTHFSFIHRVIHRNGGLRKELPDEIGHSRYVMGYPRELCRQLK